jgi:phosphinothricin acetyltransferase
MKNKMQTINMRLADIHDLPIIVDIYNQAVLTKCFTADISLRRGEDRKAWFLEHNPENNQFSSRK